MHRMILYPNTMTARMQISSLHHHSPFHLRVLRGSSTATTSAGRCFIPHTPLHLSSPPHRCAVAPKSDASASVQQEPPPEHQQQEQQPTAPLLPLTSSQHPPEQTPLGSLYIRLFPGVIFYLASFIMPLTSIAAAVGATSTCFPPSLTHLTALSSVIYAFIGMPLFDTILGNELRNPIGNPTTQTTTSKHDVYRFLLYAYALFHLSTFVLVAHILCTLPLSPLRFTLASISFGVTNGIAFTVAHELLHGRTLLEKLVSNMLLAPLWYQHWTVSHLLHHVKVATSADPSSARRGESLYAFIPRSVLGNIVDGYGHEMRRMSQAIKNKGCWWWWRAARCSAWVLGPVGVGVAMALRYGLLGVTYYTIQAVVGIIMLETVNYIEHYGLVREKKGARVAPRHSWNGNTVYTNAVTFHLQRHSDHHAHECVPYQMLKSLPHEEAPQLPGGYPAMMLVATVPPLWRRLMDPLVEEATGSTANTTTTRASVE